MRMCFDTGVKLKYYCLLTALDFKTYQTINEITH